MSAASAQKRKTRWQRPCRKKAASCGLRAWCPRWHVPRQKKASGTGHATFRSSPLVVPVGHSAPLLAKAASRSALRRSLSALRSRKQRLTARGCSAPFGASGGNLLAARENQTVARAALHHVRRHDEAVAPAVTLRA